MIFIENDLGLNHAQAGGIFLMIALGYSAALLLSGFISSRITHKRCIFLAAVWMGLSLVGIGHAHNPLLLQVALFSLGISGGIYLPSGIAAITSLVRVQDIGKAMAVHELGPNLSFFLSPLVADALLHVMDWRGIMAFLGYVSLGWAFFFALCGKGGDFTGKAPHFGMVNALLRMPAFWALGLLFSIAMGASMGPYSMLPLFLVEERGYAPEAANQLLALSRVLPILGALIAGWMTDRLGPDKAITLHLALAGISTVLLGCVDGAALPVLVLVQSFVAVLYFPAGFAAISRVFAPENRGLALSLIIPFGVLGGMGFFPTMIGFCGDRGGFALAFSIIGVLLLLALPLPRQLTKALRAAEAIPSLDRRETST